jgi:ATP-dependent Zn protease
VIFNNNFNNFNISNLDKIKLSQFISKINNNSINIHNLNIQDENDIPEFNDGIKNEDFKNFRNINIFNTINNINYDYRGEFQPNENENYYNLYYTKFFGNICFIIIG